MLDCLHRVRACAHGAPSALALEKRDLHIYEG